MKRSRAHELGIDIGVMPSGPLNAITDVPGVKVGHTTLIRGDDIRTGATAVVPHGGNLYLEKVPAAVYIGNGFGKMTGSPQIDELGTLETPIILTNTLSVGTAVSAVVIYTLDQPGNENVQSVNAVVGEVNDGYLNDIRGLHVTESDVRDAIAAAASGPVIEGSVGGGTGTVCFRYKGGIGTSSRLIPLDTRYNHSIGVLVQTNFGGSLDIVGAPFGRELKPPRLDLSAGEGRGSCMIVVATDAPLSPLNLKRLAGRSLYGLARAGSFMSNGSGDFAIAFSTAYRIAHGDKKPQALPPLVPSAAMSPYFRAVMEAAQEAVYNSLFMAEKMTGRKGRVVPAIDLDDVVRVCEKYNLLHLRDRLK